MCRWALALWVTLPAGCGDDGGTTGASGSSGSSASSGSTSGGSGSDASSGASSSGAATERGRTRGGSSGSSGTETGVGACGEGFVADGAQAPTTYGPVEGSAVGGVFAFLGVPFAAPPVGDLRWRPPVDPACWMDVRATKAFAPACLQLKDEAGTSTVGDEDCLYLNVWTPATGAGDRPVLVFIHGGGNAVGTASDPLYDGQALAETHDVVVVTLAYRLGALGFLTHAELAAESKEGVSGNYAILDLVKGLEWVRDNVAGFGGDPERVMLFGESAGAVNTCTLLGSPLAGGLFDAAIVQSGACSERSLAQYTQQVSKPWVDSSGCADAADVPGCLRALPGATVVKTTPNGYPNVAAISQGFGAHVDGFVVPKASLDAFAAGEHNHVPVIVGSNAEETAKAVPPLTDAQFTALVQSTFGILGQAVVDQILALYDPAVYGSGTAAYVALSSDVKFVCNARRSAAALAKGQTEAVFRYHFAYDGYTVPMGQVGHAFHGLELVYVFGTFAGIDLGGFDYVPNADDKAMAGLLGGAWTRFAGSGDPSGDGLSWPVYEVGSDPYTVLDVPGGSGMGLRTAECDFWDQLLGF